MYHLPIFSAIDMYKVLAPPPIPDPSAQGSDEHHMSKKSASIQNLVQAHWQTQNTNTRWNCGSSSSWQHEVGRDRAPRGNFVLFKCLAPN